MSKIYEEDGTIYAYTDFMLPKRFDKFSRGKNLPLRLRLKVESRPDHGLSVKLHTFTLIAGNEIWDKSTDYFVEQPIPLHTGANMYDCVEKYHTLNLLNLVCSLNSKLDPIFYILNTKDRKLAYRD